MSDCPTCSRENCRCEQDVEEIRYLNDPAIEYGEWAARFPLGAVRWDPAFEDRVTVVSHSDEGVWMRSGKDGGTRILFEPSSLDRLVCAECKGSGTLYDHRLYYGVMECVCRRGSE